uniref:NR LBD domain-containing protein n=1 Tax=Plectus sambesii TaxID=2011161 RepID=A0A914WTD6_9BILA
MLSSPILFNISDIDKLLSLENRLRQLRQYDLPMKQSLIDLLTHFSLFDAPEIELSRCVESYDPLCLNGSLGRSTVGVRKDCVLFTEYAKCFPVFSQLSLDDKVHIIQNNTLAQQTLTQAHHACDFGSHVSFHHEDGTKKTREVDASEVTLIIAKIIDLLVLPMRELRIDTTEVALLRVLLFLNPEQDYISPEAREALEEERRKYFSHLLEYVQKKLTRMVLSDLVLFSYLDDDPSSTIVDSECKRDHSRLVLSTTADQREKAIQELLEAQKRTFTDLCALNESQRNHVLTKLSQGDKVAAKQIFRRLDSCCSALLPRYPLGSDRKAFRRPTTTVTAQSARSNCGPMARPDWRPCHRPAASDSADYWFGDGRGLFTVRRPAAASESCPHQCHRSTAPATSPRTTH